MVLVGAGNSDGNKPRKEGETMTVYIVSVCALICIVLIFGILKDMKEDAE